MTDKDVIDYVFVGNRINNRRCSRKLFIKNKKEDVLEYLYENYDLDENSTDYEIYEVCYRIVHNIPSVPICPVCGKPIPFSGKNGYYAFCFWDCRNSDKGKEISLKRFENSCLKIYGVKNPKQNEKVKKKGEDTCMSIYGVKNPNQSERVKKKTRDTWIKKGCLLIDGHIHYSKEINDKINNTREQTNLTKYNCKNTFQSKELMGKSLNKSKTVSKINNSFCNERMSQVEKDVYYFLIEIFGDSDIIFNRFVDDRYPFNVDFYIKSLDLFIELNAHFSHGKHLFDENNEDDIKLLNKWKSKIKSKKSMFIRAIKIWTESDPLKIKTAIENKLNYLPIWETKTNDILYKILEYFEVNNIDIKNKRES